MIIPTQMSSQLPADWDRYKIKEIFRFFYSSFFTADTNLSANFFTAIFYRKFAVKKQKICFKKMKILV